MNVSTLPVVRHLARGLALAALLAAPAAAQTTVLSSPVGVMSERLNAGPSGLAFPLIGADLFVGVAAGNAGSAVQFPGGVPDGLLESGARYYLEIATGALEGERLDVDTEATLAAGGSLVLDLAADTHSTLRALPGDALAGARCVLRRHLTLADLPGMFAPALAGPAHRRPADAVSLLDSRDLETYVLAGDGAWHELDARRGGDWGRKHRAWCVRKKHRRAPVDFRDMVIPPDVSVVVHLAPGVHKTWIHEGIVRTNAFRKNLVPGMQAFATGFPVDLSPAQIGAFVDPATPLRERWVGSNIMPFADQIQVLFSGRRPVDLYFLRGDGHTWQALTRSWREDFSDKPILGATDMILVRRRNPDPHFLVPRPFDL